jgi:hypothetical protein
MSDDHELRFLDLIKGSKKFSQEEFSTTFGFIDHDILGMLKSPNAKGLYKLLRQRIEEAGPLADGFKDRFMTGLVFGDHSNSPELLAGKVAAVDGGQVLPLQQFAIGQAIAVGVGSVSHTRDLESNLTYWSAKLQLDNIHTEEEFFRVQNQYGYEDASSGFRIWREIEHARDIGEPFVFLDGPIINEWMTAYVCACDQYRDLFEHKHVIGVMKNLLRSKRLAAYGNVLTSGELFIVGTLAEHYNEEHAATEAGRINSEFRREVAPQIYRGVFKPSLVAYGFEVHRDHLDPMLRLLIADCALDHIGHEIPYLLNLVDAELKSVCSIEMIKNQIAATLHAERESLFFENVDEYQFR